MDDRVDWIIHYVVENCEKCDEEDCPIRKEAEEFDGLNPYLMDAFADIHTHGLDQHDHPELHIVLDITKEKAVPLLNSLGLRILDGERFDTPGIRNDVLAGGYDVELIKMSDDDDNIYIILPDEHNHLPDNEAILAPYKYQKAYAYLVSKMHS